MTRSTTFHRMNPSAENMVVESEGPFWLRVLCVECGWESSVRVPTAPWVHFMGHRCRLMHTTASSD